MYESNIDRDGALEILQDSITVCNIAIGQFFGKEHDAYEALNLIQTGQTVRWGALFMRRPYNYSLPMMIQFMPDDQVMKLIGSIKIAYIELIKRGYSSDSENLCDEFGCECSCEKCEDDNHEDCEEFDSDAENNRITQYRLENGLHEIVQWQRMNGMPSAHESYEPISTFLPV